MSASQSGSQSSLLRQDHGSSGMDLPGVRKRPSPSPAGPLVRYAYCPEPIGQVGGRPDIAMGMGITECLLPVDRQCLSPIEQIAASS